MNTRLALILPALMVVGMGIAAVVMGAQVSDIGAKTHALEVKTASIAAQNDSLEMTIAKQLSLTALKDEATQQGYIPRTSLTQVSGTTRLAKAN